MIKYTDYSKMFKGHSDKLNGKSLRVGRFLYFFWCKDIFWFRLFGYGLNASRDNEERTKLFSERMGLVKTYKVFGWVFKKLTPMPAPKSKPPEVSEYPADYRLPSLDEDVVD
jgi:hypothetical protein